MISSSEIFSDGAMAEQFVACYLQREGLNKVTQNYHCRFGEIDLVMWDASVLVFVEVRLRRSEYFGGGAESIDERKQRRIVRTAQHYLATLRKIPACRFDAVLMSDSQGSKIQWLKNAFDAEIN